MIRAKSIGNMEIQPHTYLNEDYITDYQRWCLDREKEFQWLRYTSPLVKCALDAMVAGRVTMEMALKIACIELAKQNAKLREHVNISELNNATPTVIVVPLNGKLTHD